MDIVAIHIRLFLKDFERVGTHRAIAVEVLLWHCQCCYMTSISYSLIYLVATLLESHKAVS